VQESPAFVVLLAAVASAGVIVALSRISGWNLLAEHYPATGDIPPARKWMGYGVFRGWMGYNGGIVVSSDVRGLYLRGMPLLLSFCHRPVFIPWSEMTRIEERSGWNGRVYAIRTRRASEVDFGLRPSTFAVVRDDARSAGVPGDY
jgi:hypothetical protein